MTLVGVAGILLSLFAAYFAELRGSRRRLVLFASLLVLHILASSVYYLLVASSGSDADIYYYDIYRWYGDATGLGTIFLINLVQMLKENLGGTFFDYFLLFQATGFWGLIFLYKAFNEMFQEVDEYQPTLTYLTLFLPGLHYWTSAVGKDGPVFLAISLSIWAAMRLKKRMLPMGIAIMIMIAVRPHVAILALVALAFATLLDRRTGLLLKGLMLAAMVAGGIVVMGSLQTTYRVDVSNADSVSDYMEARSGIDERSGADVAIVQSSLPMKVVTFWFRPFFIDAENAMGYIASVENVALLLIMAYILLHWRLVIATFRRVLYIRYALFLFGALTILLSAVNFNVGLGLRQKMMAMPCLLAILTTLLAIRLRQRSQRREIAEAASAPAMSRAPAAYVGR